MDIQISPKHLSNLNETLLRDGFRSELLIPDVQKLIYEREQQNQDIKETAALFEYGKYHTLDEVS